MWTSLPARTHDKTGSLSPKVIPPEGEITDVFRAAGLTQPDTSTVSDQFLAEMRGLKYKNVAAELRPKPEPVHNIQHDLRFIAIFLSAAVRADHIKTSVSTAKASK
jgi:hypothetical protein